MRRESDRKRFVESATGGKSANSESSRGEAYRRRTFFSWSCRGQLANGRGRWSEQRQDLHSTCLLNGGHVCDLCELIEKGEGVWSLGELSVVRRHKVVLAQERRNARRILRRWCALASASAADQIR